MIKPAKRIFLILFSHLIFCLLISNGFCATINDIIQDASPADQPVDPQNDDKKNSLDLKSSEKTLFAIQLGIFLDQTDADNQIIELKSKGFNPYIFQSVNSKGQTVYSTRIGNYDNFELATRALNNIKNNISAHALITPYDSLAPANSSAATTARIHQKPSSAVFADDSSNTYDTESNQEQPHQVFESESLQVLQEKINSLETMVEKLQDESDVRKQLTITEEEAAQDEEDILEAAGREYTLTEAGNIQFRLGFSYSYSEYDAIKESARVEDVADHTLSTSLNVSYGLKDNISVGVGIPFKYKYHKVGTVDSLEANDLGDLGLSWQFQPIKSNSDKPSIILNGNFSVPVGRSPYEIAPGEELSTSAGLYSTNLGVSVSQVSDPVVVYSSMTLSYSLPLTDINQKRDEGVLDEVDPGLGIGVGAGMGYALSYKLNLNLSFNYSYSFETTYKYKNALEASSGVGVSSGLTLGVGYKLNRYQNLNFNIGIPLTNSRSFSFGFSTPIEFEL